MNRDIIKINLKLLNSYKAEIDLLFEQILVLQSLLELDNINEFEYIKSIEKLSIQHNKITKPTENAIFSKTKRISKDSIREDIYTMATRLNKLILVVEAIEDVYSSLKDDYKIVFQLSFKNDFYDYDSKLQVFKNYVQIEDDKILKKKYENIKVRLIDIFMSNRNIMDLIKRL